MRPLLLALTLSTTLFEAKAVPVEPALFGEWVPNEYSCRSGVGVRLNKNGVTLLNGDKRKSFTNIEASYTFWGGARSDGVVVAVFPTTKEGMWPFVLHVNYGKKIGAAMIEFPAGVLRDDFPFGESLMRKCRAT